MRQPASERITLVEVLELKAPIDVVKKVFEDSVAGFVR
jgi:hypothetical protein